jgi:hypothetical protein
MTSPNSTDVELTSYPQQSPTTASRDIEPLHNSVNSDEGFSLPPTDGGKDAWLCLLACFMLEALIWGQFSMHSCVTCAYGELGFPASYGIFQEYYSTNDFAGSSNIAVVGACAMVLYTLAPRSTHLLIETQGADVYGHHFLVRSLEVLPAFP